MAVSTGSGDGEMAVFCIMPDLGAVELREEGHGGI